MIVLESDMHLDQFVYSFSNRRSLSM